MSIGRTWFIDFDGCIVKHGTNELLPGVKEWFKRLPKEDMVYICSARKRECAHDGVNALEDNGIKYDRFAYNLPLGERIVINDIKPAQTVNGETFTEPMNTARAINLKRNEGLGGIEI